jgi:hypothetical protein
VGGVLDAIRRWVPAPVRFEARQLATNLRERAWIARPWRWELVTLRREDRPYEVLYAGPDEARAEAAAVLDLEDVWRPGGMSEALSPSTALLSHLPLPRALKLPQSVHMVVPLNRPLEDIVAEYDGELRRKLRVKRPRYAMRRAVDDGEIEQLNRDMLEPYARARHGSDAVVMSLPSVRKIAQQSGRLDVITCGDQAVACHLGYPLTHDQQRYWVTLRFGYPQHVFDDRKRLSEVNSINTFLALEWALHNSFDCYDMGSCLGRPDDGLLQWKRRRGCRVETWLTERWLSLRLPRLGRPQFLWDAPLFSGDAGALALNVGLPVGKRDDEVIARYREMGFSGLSAVYVHAAKQPGAELLEAFSKLFAAHAQAPAVHALVTA